MAKEPTDSRILYASLIFKRKAYGSCHIQSVVKPVAKRGKVPPPGANLPPPIELS